MGLFPPLFSPPFLQLSFFTHYPPLQPHYPLPTLHTSFLRSILFSQSCPFIFSPHSFFSLASAPFPPFPFLTLSITSLAEPSSVSHLRTQVTSLITLLQKSLERARRLLWFIQSGHNRYVRLYHIRTPLITVVCVSTIHSARPEQ